MKNTPKTPTPTSGVIDFAEVVNQFADALSTKKGVTVIDDGCELVVHDDKGRKTLKVTYTIDLEKDV